MATAIAATKDYLAKAEQLLGQLNETFCELQSTQFHEIYEGCKQEVSRLKIEIYALGYGIKRDCTGWRLAQ